MVDNSNIIIGILAAVCLIVVVAVVMHLLNPENQNQTKNPGKDSLNDSVKDLIISNNTSIQQKLKTLADSLLATGDAAAKDIANLNTKFDAMRDLLNKLKPASPDFDNLNDILGSIQVTSYQSNQKLDKIQKTLGYDTTAMKHPEIWGDASIIGIINDLYWMLKVQIDSQCGKQAEVGACTQPLTGIAGCTENNQYGCDSVKTSQECSNKKCCDWVWGYEQ